MTHPIWTLTPEKYPASLRELPQPPKQLYLRGAPLTQMRHTVAVVGARQHSAYGASACRKIIQDLAGSGVTIISGLAIGIDAIAHETALKVGLRTIAVVGSGLDDDVLYPATNRKLAQRIVEAGGTLISENEPSARATQYTFPARNRLMAGLAQLVVAVECEEKSGTRITTRLATDYGKDVGAVPQDIFSEIGKGTNALIQQGAHVIRNGNDILDILGIEPEKPEQASLVMDALSESERKIYAALSSPKTRTELAEKVTLPDGMLQITLAKMEMKNLISESLGRVRRT